MSKIEKVMRLSRNAKDMIKYNRIAKKYADDPKYKDMWLISERGVEAKDNGYAFFKYLRKEHPEINAWYVIDPSYKKDYDRVSNLGNIIEYGSLDHKIAFVLCKYAISTHTGFLEPWNYKLYKMIIDRKNKKKFVFLQHGIISNDLSMYLNGSSGIDMFVTTTNNEYKALCGDNYGFKDGVVVKTGLARYDNLNDFSLKNQIMLMPTWRSGIINMSYENKGTGNEQLFLNSDYYKTLNSLINNKKLIKMLEDNDLELVFYPHFETQPYKHNFNISSDRIIMADQDEYNVQDLLKSSKLLITDFSSVFFDFAYMNKPVLYYHKVPDTRYAKGYFDYTEDGFGEVCFEEDKLVDYIEEYIKNGFKVKDKYKDRVNNTFCYRDNKNCERIFNAIQNIQR